jgi:aspartyl-tRNA(Asn)/glutamyl-tRNA(Gln) amidotransferase subunit C
VVNIFSVGYKGAFMKLTKKDVEYVAKLARLELNEEEKEKYTLQLAQILEYVSKLEQLNTQNIEPTSHVLSLENVFRDDEVKPSLSRDEVLANAPETEDGYFKVKKVIE